MTANAPASLSDARCTVCTSPRRAELEEVLAMGSQSVRSLAREHGLSRDSLRRHALRHIPIAQRSEFIGTPGLRALDLAQRLLDTLDHAEEVRADADARGDDRTALSASRAITAATEQLADRLGITNGDTLRDMTDADALAAAIEQVIRTVPTVGEVMADALRDAGNIALARLVGDFAQRQRAALEAAQTA